MASQRTPGIKLSQPDRSGPSEKTLLQLADERRLFAQAQQRQRLIKQRQQDVHSPPADRMLDALLWTASLAMLHLTFDVLVQHQYATEISWVAVCLRTCRAWIGSQLLPFRSLPPRWHRPLRQAVFFALALAAACRLVFVSNAAGYLAVMKQAPPLVCLCVWAVIELDLLPATFCLALVALYIYLGNYQIK